MGCAPYHTDCTIPNWKGTDIADLAFYILAFIVLQELSNWKSNYGDGETTKPEVS